MSVTIGCSRHIRLPAPLELDDTSVRIDGLTPRQRQVLGWSATGKTDWEIGQILLISAKTVNFHVERAKRCLNAQTRQQAIATLVACNILGTPWPLARPTAQGGRT